MASVEVDAGHKCKVQDYKSRKFFLTMVFTATTIAALFLDKISGGEFVAVATLILGVYGASNVGAKYVANH